MKLANEILKQGLHKIDSAYGSGESEYIAGQETAGRGRIKNSLLMEGISLRSRQRMPMLLIFEP